MSEPIHLGSCERLGTFDDWLQRFQVQARQPTLSSAQIDRLYSLYLDDWSVDSATRLGDEGLQPIGLHIAHAMDRIQVAYDAHRITPEEIEAMFAIPPKRSVLVDTALFLCGAVFGAAGCAAILSAMLHAAGR